MNIFMDNEGRVKVGDFGLAGLMELGQRDSGTDLLPAALLRGRRRRSGAEAGTDETGGPGEAPPRGARRGSPARRLRQTARSKTLQRRP